MYLKPPRLVRPRASNPRKFDRCVTEVRRAGSAVNPYAVCRAALKRKRRKNPSRYPRQARATASRRSSGGPRFTLHAQRPGGRKLTYVGHRKFAERGRAKAFKSVAAAEGHARALLKRFPMLRSYQLSVRGA